MSSRWITHYFMHEEDFYLSPLLHPERMISSKSLLSLFSCCIFFCQGFASVNSSAGTTAFRPRRCCKGVKKGTSSVSAEFLAHPVIRYTVTDERRFVMVGSSVQTIRIPDWTRCGKEPQISNNITRLKDIDGKTTIFSIVTRLPTTFCHDSINGGS
jgi:hypothetical protein